MLYVAKRIKKGISFASSSARNILTFIEKEKHNSLDYNFFINDKEVIVDVFLQAAQNEADLEHKGK